MFFAGCNNVNIGVIGGSDSPTSIIVSKKKDDISRSYDVDKYFRKNYVNERKLPMTDIHIENPFNINHRTLILDDSIENNLELMIYEYYLNRVKGDYSKVKNAIVGESLNIATENEEKQFNDGIYFSKIILDEIELVDKEDLNGISDKNKHAIIGMLNDLGMSEFAIIEVEKTVKLNEKYLSMGPQIGDGDVTRYYLLGKKDNEYKILEVYWEGFIIG